MKISPIVFLYFIASFNLSLSSPFNPSGNLDVIIPCHEKDYDKLELVLDGIKKYAQGIRRIIIVSNKRLSENAEWFDEKEFPFDKNTIAYEIFQNENQNNTNFYLVYANTPGSRTGWFFQQFIKLYALFVIPDLTNQILIVDADTIFLKPISFFNSDNKILFNVSTIENHRPYFEHAEKLLPNFNRKYPQYSGITHHIVLDKFILTDLFDTIREYHHLEPWKAMCRLIDKRHTHPKGSAMSEYEIYFNFALSKYPEKTEIRPLRWQNMRFSTFRDSRNGNDLDYVSCHSWL